MELSYGQGNIDLPSGPWSILEVGRASELEVKRNGSRREIDLKS